MKPKRYRRLIILICGFFVLVAVMGLFYRITMLGNTDIKPINGILDLKNWNSKVSGRITLSGQWEFHRSEFVPFGQASDNWTIVEAPSVWSGSGFGTYILKVENVMAGVPLALYIPNISTSYELYIDNHLLSTGGRVASKEDEYKPWQKSEIVEFTPEGKNFSIIIHAANFAFNQGGMRYTLSLGSPSQIHSMGKFVADKDLFLFGALVVMAFYYLLIFLLRPDDKSSLYFVLMCLIFACRITVLGDYLIYRFLPFINYRSVVVLDFLTTVWFSISAVFMVRRLFPKEFSKMVLNLFLTYGVLMSVIILFCPVAFFTGFIVPVQYIAIAIGVYGNCCLVVAFIRGENEAGLIFIGGVALAFSALHDVLYNNSVISSSIGEWVAIAQFLLVLLQAFILARRFSDAFKRINILSQKLIKLDKIKDEFLANTSHELRTPLSGILGITEGLLRGSAGELSSAQKHELVTIAGSSRRLTNLVNEILDYSKMKNGDIRLYIAPLRLDGIISSVINVFRQLNASNGFDIFYEIPEGLPPTLADENRVVQILYNLLGNAVKFTVQGYIKVSVTKTGNMLEVCVSDTGEGIPEERLEDIFKSFEQVDNSLTRRYGGTGLGLSITKQLVELQNGSIWVESSLGKGSAFHFTLPVASGIPEENDSITDFGAFIETTASVDPSGIINEGGNPSILLVDDDRVSLQASAAILGTDGYAITAVNCGKAALEALKGNSEFSIVILDVMMPEISGYEVCRKLRENKSPFELPVLMLTARTSTQDIVTGFAAGANDYLPKPFEPDELLARVRTLTTLKASVDRAMTAEIGFLQAQIKPHFLFNALNTIASFCSTDPIYARKLINGFANYLRQSFDFESIDTFIPVEREIELVKNYVEIEQARFGDKLAVAFDIENMINAQVFPLSIQPLVENAIRHGLRKNANGGTVTVSVRQADGDVLVSVSDDGCGIAPDRLKYIMSPNNGRQGVGLWNIDRRLRKLFGQGLIIESDLGKGTTIRFIIPSRGD